MLYKEFKSDQPFSLEVYNGKAEFNGKPVKLFIDTNTNVSNTDSWVRKVKGIEGMEIQFKEQLSKGKHVVGILTGLSPDEELSLLAVQEVDREYNYKGELVPIPNQGILIFAPLSEQKADIVKDTTNQLVIHLSSLDDFNLEQELRQISTFSISEYVHMPIGELRVRLSTMPRNILVSIVERIRSYEQEHGYGMSM